MSDIKKLAFIVRDTSVSQLNYLLFSSINKYLMKNGKTDIILFVENYTPHLIKLHCSIMPLNELSGYDGVAVATSIKTAAILAENYTVADKYFYVYDLEWSHQDNKNYEILYPIYQHEKLKIITRTPYKKLIENLWDRKVFGIWDNCNIETLIKEIVI